MKILHVANFNYKKCGLNFWAVAYKLSNGFVRNGHNVLNFSDRDVARAGNPLGMRKLGVRWANARLLDACCNFRPDLVLFGHADTIRPDTLDAIRAMLPEVRLAQWNVDPLFEPDNVARLLGKAAHVDLTFVTTAGPALLAATAPGAAPAAFMPNPVDPGIESGRAFAVAEPPHDLFYAVGSPRVPRQWDGTNFDVEALVRRLRAALPELRCDFHGLEGRPVVDGAPYFEALARSPMALNLSRRNDNYLYASDRMAHILGNGALAVTDRATGFAEIFGEDEMAFYGDTAEMFDRLRFFARADGARRRAAEAGWRKAHGLFDGARVARYLLERIAGAPLSLAYGWPTELWRGDAAAASATGSQK
ncbi:MAG TPA: glycosyltransferase [Alphaproteobacteria bacterium]|nr:glycosyltransferase [Alphaproteobacteria bacterium]